MTSRRRMSLDGVPNEEVPAGEPPRSPRREPRVSIEEVARRSQRELTCIAVSGMACTFLIVTAFVLLQLWNQGAFAPPDSQASHHKMLVRMFINGEHVRALEHLTRLVTDDASYRNANFWSLMKTFLQRSHFSKLADDAIGASLDLVESLEAHGEPAPQADLQRLREHVHSIVLHHSDEHPGKPAGERIKQEL